MPVTIMRKRRLWLMGVFVCLAATVARAQKNESASAAATLQNSGPVRFEPRSFHKEFGKDCISGGRPAPCLKVDFQYPEPVSAPTQAGKARITKAIQKYMLGDSNTPLSESESFEKSLSSQVQDLYDDEKNVRAQSEFPLREVGWELSRWVKIEYQSPSVLVLSCNEYEFTGGAHGNSTVRYVNLRPSTGEPIRLQDILKPGFEKPLNAIGEARFRALEGLDPKAGLRENNFWFPNDQFQLNDNFFIDPKGVTFVYNPYEVNCYACGPPIVLLPYSDLRDLLRPDANIP